MSHVVSGEKITNAAAIQATAAELGFSVEDRTYFKVWMGRNAEAKSEFVLTHPNSKYEIGVVPVVENGVKSYDLQCDDMIAYAIPEIVGRAVQGKNGMVHLPRFRLHYNMMVDRMAAAASGDSISFHERADGTWEGLIEVNPERLFASTAV